MVMAHVAIEEFDRFWSVFRTRGAEMRARYGSRGSSVFKNRENPGEVVVLFDWDRPALEAFLADPAVRETMKSGGALGAPRFTFLEEAGALPA